MLSVHRLCESKWLAMSQPLSTASRHQCRAAASGLRPPRASSCGCDYNQPFRTMGASLRRCNRAAAAKLLLARLGVAARGGDYSPQTMNRDYARAKRCQLPLLIDSASARSMTKPSSCRFPISGAGSGCTPHGMRGPIRSPNWASSTARSRASICSWDRTRKARSRMASVGCSNRRQSSQRCVRACC
jgi:hypothetical protein